MLLSLRASLLLQLLLGLRAIRTREEVEVGDLALSDFPALCDEEIVAQTCKHLNGGERDGLKIHRDHLADAISKTAAQMQHLWDVLGLPADEMVACPDVCNALVEYIKDWHILPPRSDLGCYTIGRRWFCDADVRPEQLTGAGLLEGADIPDLHDEETVEGQAIAGMATYRRPENAAVTSWQLVERVANLFRVFPAESPDKEEALAPWTMEDASSTTEGLRVMKRSGQIAEAYLAAALRASEHHQAGNEMKTWFGAADGVVLRNVRLTLNSAADMLSKAYFVYPGPLCTARQIGYVLPFGRECSRLQLSDTEAHCATHQEKFVLYLCPWFLKKPHEQVLTLIHEASHHATAFTEDVCADPEKPPEEEDCKPKGYGRASCKLLATQMQARALINADNYCYYVQDVVKHISASDWTPLRPRVAAHFEPFACPPLAAPRGPFCRCLEGNRCFQGREEGCRLATSTSLEYSLPTCRECQCTRCPRNAQLLPGGKCECHEQFRCASTAGDGCDSDSRKFSLIDCPTCFCERPPRSTPSKYKAHELCTEPCGSIVKGQELAEDRCAQCFGDSCFVQQCELDVCADVKCGDFELCKPRDGKPNCRCFSQYQETADGCQPIVEDNWRCCYTGLSQSRLSAVWVPRPLQITNWRFHHVCPNVDGTKWRKAPREECKGVVYKHPDNHFLGLGVDI